jgi:hypothetical protein
MSSVNIGGMKPEFHDAMDDNVHQEGNHNYLNQFIFKVFEITPKN